MRRGIEVENLPVNRLTLVLLSTYLGLAPVNWWPGVEPQVLDCGKLIIIGLAVSLVWCQALMIGRFHFPAGVLGPMGLIVLLGLSITAVAQSSVETSLMQVKDYLLPFLMLWTFVFYVNMKQDYIRVLIVATLIVGVHSVLVVSSKFLGVPHWSGPKSFVASDLWISGFSSLRTGWSSALAPFVPVALYVAMARMRGLTMRIIFAVTAGCIMLSQLVVAGRAGILASVIGIVWIVTGRGQRRWLPVMAGIGAVAILIAGDFLYEAMRLKDLGEGKLTSIHALNKFSAHRINSDIVAWKYFVERPFVGHGFREIVFGGGSEIHNLWLRLAVEAGMFLPVGLAWVVWKIWSSSRSRWGTIETEKGHAREARFWQSVLLMGVVISMFEPRYLLGAFQLSALWWAIAGIVVGRGAGLRSAAIQESRVGTGLIEQPTIPIKRQASMGAPQP